MFASFPALKPACDPLTGLLMSYLFQDSPADSKLWDAVGSLLTLRPRE